MPIYEYLCDDCGNRYERIVMSETQPIACPKCSSNRHTLQLSVFRAASKSSAPSAKAPSPAGSCACTPTSCGCH